MTRYDERTILRPFVIHGEFPLKERTVIMVAPEIREKIRSLFNGPTLSQLATMNRRGRPWTRYVMSDMDDEMIVRIPTRRDTRKVEEIRAFPFVHVLVGKNLFAHDSGYAQIEGRAILTDNVAGLARFWHYELRRFLTDPRDPAYILIEIYPERIEYWSLSEEKNPQVLEKGEIGPNHLILTEPDRENYYDATLCGV